MSKFGVYPDTASIADADSGLLKKGTGGTEEFTFSQVLAYVAAGVSLAASRITSGALATARGGFGQDMSGATGIAKWAAGALSFVTAPTGALVGTSDAQTLTNKTLTSPTISNATLSGTSSTTSNNAKGTCTDVNPVNVQTTDATVTTLDSFTVPSNSTVIVSWLVSAARSTLAEGAGYAVTAAFKNNAGTVTQIGSAQVTSLEDNSAWAATADFNGTTARLRVTGAAATTIQWSAIRTQLAVIP